MKARLKYAGLYVCLSVCQYVSLSVSLSVCQYACLAVCISAVSAYGFRSSESRFPGSSLVRIMASIQGP